MREMHGLNSNPGQEKGLLQERRMCVWHPNRKGVNIS